MIKGLLRANSVSLILSLLRGMVPEIPLHLQRRVFLDGPLPKDEIMQSHLNTSEELASETGWVSSSIVSEVYYKLFCFWNEKEKMVNFCLENFREVKENRDCLWRSWHPGEWCLKTTGSCVWRTVFFWTQASILQSQSWNQEKRMKLSERMTDLEHPALGILSSWGPCHNPPSTQAVSGTEKPGQVRPMKPEGLCDLLRWASRQLSLSLTLHMALGPLDKTRGKRESQEGI